MKIFLREITETETFLQFTQEEPWVLHSVLQIDEKLDQPKNSLKKRPIQTEFNLRQVDDVIIISGKINTFLELVCSRCACIFEFLCTPQFSALFCKDPILAGIAHLQKSPSHPHQPGRPFGQNHGFARHTHDPEDDLMISQGKDLDITYLTHDFIDLGDVLAEQLQLQVPFQPLCKESCQGLCSSCGTDLNLSCCTCPKVTRDSPFQALGDFNL